MKIRESGMPEESVWSSFFDPERLLCTFGIDSETKHVVEFGCGYGTFTLATARIVSGVVFAIDLDLQMTATVQEECKRERISNVHVGHIDFVTYGTSLPKNFADAALLFNILHIEDPVPLLQEAWRILSPGGKALIIHWNHDPSTPRGPSMEIRPRPEQCIKWGREAGFIFNPEERFDLKPYHYGIILRKPL